MRRDQEGIYRDLRDRSGNFPDEGEDDLTQKFFPSNFATEVETEQQSRPIWRRRELPDQREVARICFLLAPSPPWSRLLQLGRKSPTVSTLIAKRFLYRRLGRA